MYDFPRNRTRGFDWGLFLVGTVSVILSIFMFRNPGRGLRGMIIVIAVLAILQGIVWISIYVNLRRVFSPSWTAIIPGIFDIVIGLLFLFNNQIGAMTISILVSVWFIIDSIIGIVCSWYLRIIETGWQFFFSVLLNIATLVLGVLLLCQPIIAGLSVVYLVACYLLIFGINEIVWAFANR